MLPETHFLNNAILAGLPREETLRLLPHCESVSLACNDTLYREGQPIHYVYFPRTAMLSVLVMLTNGSVIEVAAIGSEGLLGIRTVLGGKRSDSTATVQVPGDCLRVRADVLVNEFERRGELHRRLLHYMRYMVASISQSAACNRVHLLEQRLCRWLLVLYRRVRCDEFSITHETIAQRLGTPRSEVSIAAKFLQDRGIIRYHRGKMRIVDPALLESLACECYRIVNREMENLVADLASEPVSTGSLRFPTYADTQTLIA